MYSEEREHAKRAHVSEILMSLSPSVSMLCIVRQQMPLCAKKA
jgi:hypothetical protein